jgi:uncharacterized membrane protein
MASTAVCVRVTPRMRTAYAHCVRELPIEQAKSIEFQQIAAVFRAAKAAAAAAAATPTAPAAPPATLTYEQIQTLSRLYRSTLPADADVAAASANDTDAAAADETSPGRGYVHELLRGSSVQPLPVARSTRRQDPEFKRYLEEQRIKQERREYNRMVADLPGNRFAADRAEREEMSSMGSEYASAQRDIGHGINVLTLMATGFIVFYYVGTSLFPHNQVFAILTGLLGLIAALMLEVCLFLVREQKKELVESAQEKMARAEKARVREHTRRTAAETQMELKRREMMVLNKQTNAVAATTAGHQATDDSKLD